jgi:hypothetical protein
VSRIPIILITILMKKLLRFLPRLYKYQRYRPVRWIRPKLGSFVRPFTKVKAVEVFRKIRLSPIL